MKATLCVWFVCLLALFQAGGPTPAPAGPLRLEKTSEVLMLLNHDEGPRPYFRIDLNILDQNGNAVPIKMPDGNVDLRDLIEIIKDGKTYHPFYVSTVKSEEGQRQAGQQQYQPQSQPVEVMFLVDISGSMCRHVDGRNETLDEACASPTREGTRFAAAKEAAGVLLQNFEEKVDRIAIIPFESHDVGGRIRRAEFVNTRAAAMSQINNLPPPKTDNRTALYSAAVEAVKVLKSRKEKGEEAKQVLFILSDGENYVEQADKEADPTLLDRTEQVDVVTQTIKEADITTFTIGFGAADAKLDALRAIAYPSSKNFSRVAKPEQLKTVVQKNQQSFINRIRITFQTDDVDYKALNSVVRFGVRFRPPLQEVENREILYQCIINACVKQGDLDQAEVKALRNPNVKRGERADTRAESIWKRMLRSLLTFFSFSALLALLWYGPPRLLWPHPALPSIPGQAAQLGRAASLLGRGPRPQKPGPRPRPSAKPDEAPRQAFDKTALLDDHLDGPGRRK